MPQRIRRARGHDDLPRQPLSADDMGQRRADQSDADERDLPFALGRGDEAPGMRAARSVLAAL